MEIEDFWPKVLLLIDQRKPDEKNVKGYNSGNGTCLEWQYIHGAGYISCEKL